MDHLVSMYKHKVGQGADLTPALTTVPQTFEEMVPELSMFGWTLEGLEMLLLPMVRLHGHTP